MHHNFFLPKDVVESFHSLLEFFKNPGNRTPDESSCDFEDVGRDTNVTNDLSEEEQMCQYNPSN